jgi:hypothetical protein
MIHHFIEEPITYFYRPWKLPLDLFREMKAFIHRGLFGWHFSDTWSMDVYLAEIISDMLRALAYEDWITEDGRMKKPDKHEKNLKKISQALGLYLVMMDIPNGFTFEETNRFLDRARAQLPELVSMFPTLRSRKGKDNG